MTTDCLFREDSYLKECSATVVGLTESGGVLLDLATPALAHAFLARAVPAVGSTTPDAPP